MTTSHFDSGQKRIFMGRKKSTTFTRVPKTIQEQLEIVIAGHIENRLPRNKNRRNRNGCGNPLSAWMLGARGNGSKIIQVTTGNASYPYYNHISSVRVLAERIAKRYKITWHQYDRLIIYLLGYYRGDQRDGGTKRLGMFDDDGHGYIEGRTLILDEVEHKLKTVLPLRAIIDPNVTNLVLMHQFEQAFKSKFSKGTQWK